MRDINKIILHCSASDVDSYDFHAITKDHLARGWIDIGYHYGIDYDGDIHILRPIKTQGAHTKGHNSGSIGICILGLHRFSHTQVEQCAKLVLNMMQIFDLTSKDVYGHYEFTKNKTCPNIDMDMFRDVYLESDEWL